MAGLSIVALCVVAADAGMLVLGEPFASRVPPERHVPFLAVGAAHLASYTGAVIGAAVLVACVWRSRQGGPRPA